MPSDAVNRFLESLHGGPDWRDGLDLEAFRQATPAEQAQLVSGVEAALQQHSDARLPRALLATAGPSALPLLLQSLRRADGLVSVAAGRAVLDLAFAEVSDALYRVARDRAQSREARSLALSTLHDLPGWEVTYFFVDLLEDPEPLIRREAAGLVFMRTGLSRRPSDPNLGPRLLMQRVQSPYETLWRPAVAELKAIADTSPPESYLFPPQTSSSDELSRFQSSLTATGPIDAQAAARLTGEERLLALTWLGGMLAQGDSRARVALEKMSDPTADALLAESNQKLVP